MKEVKSKQIECVFCGSKTHEGFSDTTVWHGGKLFVVEKVPAEICPKCQESYIAGPTLKKIDEILDKAHGRKVTKKITVELIKTKVEGKEKTLVSAFSLVKMKGYSPAPKKSVPKSFPPFFPPFVGLP